jgi:hypothetical protein
LERNGSRGSCIFTPTTKAPTHAKERNAVIFHVEAPLCQSSKSLYVEKASCGGGGKAKQTNTKQPPSHIISLFFLKKNYFILFFSALLSTPSTSLLQDQAKLIKPTKQRHSFFSVSCPFLLNNPLLTS